MTSQGMPSGARTLELCPALPPHLNRPRLNTEEAAEYLLIACGLKVAATTLAKLRCVGGGPVFQKFSRFPLYTRQALDDWALSKTSPVVGSTSELPETYRKRGKKPAASVEAADL